MGDTMSSYIVAYLHGGVYRVTEPIKLGSADSGSSDNKRVVFRNYPGESPIISGGVPVTGWDRVEGEEGVWTASTAGIADFLQLYAEGHDLVRAHTEPVEGERWTVGTKNQATKTREHQIRVPADAVPAVENLAGAHVRIMHTWRELRYPIASIGDPVTEGGKEYRYIRLGGDIANWSSEPRDKRGPNPLSGGPAKKVEVSGETVFSGAREFMDKNGEWYLDPVNDQVYLKANFDPREVDISAPAQEKLLSVNGAKHLTVYGLQFAHSAWNTPLMEGNFQRQGGVRMWDSEDSRMVLNEDQTIKSVVKDNGTVVGAGDGVEGALWWINPAAVEVAYSSDIRFNRNGFRDTGANAVNLDKGTRNIEFKANIFTNIADTGLFVGTHQWPWLPENEQNIDTVVVDNVFDGMGQTYATDSAITMTYPNGAEIRNNDIHEVHNIAINIGYVQGMLDVRKDLTEVNITKNRIDNVCITARDCGAWHAVGLARFSNVDDRSQVARNYITDIQPNPHTDTGSRVYALYADGASGGWLLKHNVWEDVKTYPGKGTIPGLRINAKTQNHGVTMKWDWHQVEDPYGNPVQYVKRNKNGDPVRDKNGNIVMEDLMVWGRVEVKKAIAASQVNPKPTETALIEEIKAEAGLSTGYGFLKSIDLAEDSVGGTRGPIADLS